MAKDAQLLLDLLGHLVESLHCFSELPLSLLPLLLGEGVFLLVFNGDGLGTSRQSLSTEAWPKQTLGGFP